MSLRRRVLVVEDDRTLRSLYRSALTAAGYDVVAVEDGLDALRHIDETPPSVVVLDLTLPRLGGRDVQREMLARRDARHIPIIVVTGTDVSDLDPTGVASVLEKPVAPERLVAAVERCLGPRPRRRTQPT